MSDLYEPVVFSKPGLCPKCHTRLCIHTLEFGYGYLTDDANPQIEFTNISSMVECPKCGFKSGDYELTPVGYRYFPVYDWISDYTRNKEIRDFRKSFGRPLTEEKTFEGNPFTL